MQHDIKDYNKKCPKRHKNKSGSLNKETMLLTDIAYRPFENV